MTNKLPCYIVRDMLPQYAEDLLAEESKKDIEQHLEECGDCSELYRQMTSPEPEIEVDTAEVDYLKKVKKNRSRIITAAVVIVALIAGGAFINSRIQAAKATINFDEASKTMVIYGKDDTDIKIPKTINDADNLDAQFDTFHTKVNLAYLRNGETALEEYIPAYLGRTNQSLKFIRDYMREYSNNEGLTARAEKFVDLSIMNPNDYSWTEQDDRIELRIGDYYWHREEMYVLSLLGSNIVQWKHLGYAWYLGSCVDPYAEVLPVVLSDEHLKTLPFYELYTKAGGTDAATPENYRILNDVVSYTCLTEGLYWGGSPYEANPLKNTAIYHAPSKVNDPGDEMSVCMATSFIGYLSDKYGFDKVSEFCFSDKTFKDAFGTDYQSAYDSWAEWIVTTYGE